MPAYDGSFSFSAIVAAAVVSVIVVLVAGVVGVGVVVGAPWNNVD